MELLSRTSFLRAAHHIDENARGLEKKVFEDHFVCSCEEELLRSLREYQNQDGGFGHALEPDFRMPQSSPLATSIAFRTLVEHDGSDSSKDMILKGIRYLQSTYDPARGGWYSVPKEVNDHPHAPWWEYDINEGMTAIDRSWGNPSAEIIGCLYRYRDLVTTLDVGSLVSFAIGLFCGKGIYVSEHETYCYIKLFDSLDGRTSEKLHPCLMKAVHQLVCFDTSRWGEYVPRPLDFVSSQKNGRFGIPPSELDINLDYLVGQISSKGYIGPHWDTSYYGPGLKDAVKEWEGVLTLRALMLLDEFKRIEK